MRRAPFWSLATFFWAMLGLFMVIADEARAEDAQGNIPSLGSRWVLRNAKPTLSVPLSSALSLRQRSIIEGGFTTLTQLTLRLAEEPDPPKLPGSDKHSLLPLAQHVRCTVKFDAWEETYDVARFEGETAQTSTLSALVKDFDEYGSLCLTGEIDKPEALERLVDGGALWAWLVVKQTSQDEAARIKDWLIQQQSGVMQGLFSHMLGELTLSQRVLVRIIVPPRPEALLENLDPKANGAVIIPASTKG